MLFHAAHGPKVILFYGLVMRSGIGQGGINPLVAQELLDTGDLAARVEELRGGYVLIQWAIRCGEYSSDAGRLVCHTDPSTTTWVGGLRAPWARSHKAKREKPGLVNIGADCYFYHLQKRELITRANVN